MAKRFDLSNVENKEKGWASSIREMESTDKLGRKLTPEMYNLGEFLHQKNYASSVKIFNWLAETTVKYHEKDGKKYAEIILPERLRMIINTMKTVFLEGGFGVLANQNLKTSGVFIRGEKKPEWQFPEYKRKEPLPFDVESIIHGSTRSMKVVF